MVKCVCSQILAHAMVQPFTYKEIWCDLDVGTFQLIGILVKIVQIENEEKLLPGLL